MKKIELYKDKIELYKDKIELYWVKIDLHAHLIGLVTFFRPSFAIQDFKFNITKIFVIVIFISL